MTISHRHLFALIVAFFFLGIIIGVSTTTHGLHVATDLNQSLLLKTAFPRHLRLTQPTPLPIKASQQTHHSNHPIFAN